MYIVGCMFDQLAKELYIFANNAQRHERGLDTLTLTQIVSLLYSRPTKLYEECSHLCLIPIF